MLFSVPKPTLRQAFAVLKQQSLLSLEPQSYEALKLTPLLDLDSGMKDHTAKALCHLLYMGVCSLVPAINLPSGYQMTQSQGDLRSAQNNHRISEKKSNNYV